MSRSSLTEQGDIAKNCIITDTPLLASEKMSHIILLPSSLFITIINLQPPRLSERNGKIVGYYIRYGRLGTEMLSKMTIRWIAIFNTLSYFYLSFYSRDVNSKQAIIGSLTPFTKYEVLVNPFNKVGSGPASSKAIVSTLEGGE